MECCVYVDFIIRLWKAYCVDVFPVLEIVQESLALYSRSKDEEEDPAQRSVGLWSYLNNSDRRQPVIGQHICSVHVCMLSAVYFPWDLCSTYNAVLCATVVENVLRLQPILKV